MYKHEFASFGTKDSTSKQNLVRYSVYFIGLIVKVIGQLILILEEGILLQFSFYSFSYRSLNLLSPLPSQTQNKDRFLVLTGIMRLEVW